MKSVRHTLIGPNGVERYLFDCPNDTYHIVISGRTGLEHKRTLDVSAVYDTEGHPNAAAFLSIQNADGSFRRARILYPGKAVEYPLADYSIVHVPDNVLDIPERLIPYSVPPGTKVRLKGIELP